MGSVIRNVDICESGATETSLGVTTRPCTVVPSELGPCIRASAVVFLWMYLAYHAPINVDLNAKWKESSKVVLRRSLF